MKSAPGDRLRRLALPLGWMAAIAVFSSSLFGADRTGGLVLAVLGGLMPGAAPATLELLHGLLRKLGHLAEYGLLAVLWLGALGPERLPGPRAAWAVGLSAAYAVLDEARQGLAPNRSPSAADVAIDTVGALLGVAWGGGGSLAPLALGIARATAAGLGLLSLAWAAVDLGLGLSAWDLLGAAAGLAGLAWGLGRVARVSGNGR